MKNNKYDVLIVGGGPAGIFATSLAHIKGLKPLLIESNDYLGGQPLMVYSQKIVEDYPGYNKIKAYQLMANLISQLKKTKVNYFLKTKIISYLPHSNGFEIQLSNNQKIQTKTILIATGPGMFLPNRLEINGSNHFRVHYNVEEINVYKNKDVIILGGGDSAVDWANELSQATKSITIIHRRNEFRANGSNVNRLANNRVKILLNYEILKIQNNCLFCKNNSSKKTLELPFDFVIVQYGQTINTDGLKVFKGLKTTETNRIPVDISQVTNLSNIYAIGNICTYEGKPSSIICAHGEAAVAVRHILNHIKQYDKSINK
ncbi:MAG: NAD(P)/FAD-dependent oxidoreductase [Mycoplasmataceae bacterium]|nr:NAD(P)/FAD-dependent oxidoreductase [Mycoplasmataceae bacterium]